MKVIIIIFFSLLFLETKAQVSKNDSLIDTPNIKVRIPEVQELLFVVYSISETGLHDTLTINQKTDYYKSVINKFYAYKDEKCVKRIGLCFKNYYNQLRMDACNYYITENGSIIKNKDVKNLSWGNKDFFKKHIKYLEDFAKKTDFIAFYKQNTLFYNSIIEAINFQTQPETQKKWLEDKFNRKYSICSIYISPLSWGRHSTNNYVANGQNQMAIFVSAPNDFPTLSREIGSALNVRMLFTEIDHNYVNPESDLHLKKIKEAFRNREKWTDKKFTDYYSSEYAVFNEYMTWAVFILYAYDNYNGESFKFIKSNVENMMINYRGFIRFSQFSDQLLALYIKKEPSPKIDNLFKPILEWCTK